MKTVVFPGRFQPFHNAHLVVLKRLLKKYGKVIVAIGSCDVQNRNNPFSAKQRKEMIQQALHINKNQKTKNMAAKRTRKASRQNEAVSFAFIPYARDSRWVGVFLRAVPRNGFDLIFTNNKRVQKQLRKHGIPFIKSKLIKRNNFEGKKLRLGCKGWEQSVPEAVASYINLLR